MRLREFTIACLILAGSAGVVFGASKADRSAYVTVAASTAEQPDEIRELTASLLRELTASVHRLNEPKPAESLWDRPIMITLIGSVALGVLTTAWQLFARKREMALMAKQTLINEQTQLLKELPRTYEHIGEIVNSWFVTVIWIAEETNKSQDEKTAANIVRWKAKADDLEVRYSKAEPLAGLLARIGVVYSSEAVRNGAKALSDRWREFADAFQAFSLAWNASQKLAPADIQDARTTRQARLAQLESTKESLLAGMTNELFSSRQKAA